jgi:hypothetical protein
MGIDRERREGGGVVFRPNRVSLSLVSILSLARYRANVWCDGWNSCNGPLLYLEWVMGLSLSRCVYAQGRLFLC